MNYCVNKLILEKLWDYIGVKIFPFFGKTGSMVWANNNFIPETQRLGLKIVFIVEIRPIFVQVFSTKMTDTY